MKDFISMKKEKKFILPKGKKAREISFLKNSL